MADQDNDSVVQDFISGYASIADYIEDGKKSVVDGIRTSNCFPTGLARDKFSTYPSFARVVQSLDDLVTRVSDKLMKLENGVRNIYIPDEEQRFLALEEVNDVILERCNFKTDSIAGHLRRAPGLTEELTRNKQPSNALALPGNISKPQWTFSDAIDNSSSLWKPIIKYKPNSLNNFVLKQIHDSNNVCIDYEHPYKYEIECFDPVELMLNKQYKNATFEPLGKTPFVFVDTRMKLERLVEDLELSQEFSVDLEHNDRRSYQGITCLIQISTDTTDYVVDVFVLRDDIHLLNQPFTNPKILKIFHGANSDILWLQRDFGVYVVGMFDTFQASQELNFSQKSLAALIKRYCNIVIDKKYQRADWRIRPIPEVMINYARADTRYLLYIWRKMYEELLLLGHGSYERLKSVFDASKQVCLLTYKKRQLHENSYKELLYRTIGKSLNYKQNFALRRLYEWRDTVARKEDESVDYILPRHMILGLAEILPKEKEGILELCLPKPVLLMQYLHEIHSIILTCRDITETTNEIATQENTQVEFKKPLTRELPKKANIYENFSKEDFKLVSKIKVPSKWDNLSITKVDSSEHNSNKFKFAQQKEDNINNTFKDFPKRMKFC